LVMAAVLLTGCGLNTGSKNVPPGQVKFEIIYSEKLPSAATKWYQDNFAVDGLHSFTAGDYRYILVSVGEKPTGGYVIEDLKLSGTEKEIAVTARLRSPKSGEMVTMALTYPHILVKLKEDGRQLKFGGVQGHVPKSTEKPGEKQNFGTYVGQIDANSIEIEVSGALGSPKLPMAFRLSEEIKGKFESLKLNTGDEVLFTYTVNEHNQQILSSLRKINR